MSVTSNDWLVVYRIRFAEVVDSIDTRFDAPKHADVWRFGPENVKLDDRGLPIYRSRVWGGIAIYQDREVAEADTLNPVSALPFCSDADECWSALLLPISHKGQVNWRGAVETSSAIRSSVDDPGGPLVIVTSAGFISQESDQIPRIAKFTTSADQVMRDFKLLDSNLRSSIFYAMHDKLDGVTVTLWRDDKAMHHAAYIDGKHSDLVKVHRRTPMIDRISNTRTRVVLSNGKWDGSNPINEIGNLK